MSTSAWDRLRAVFRKEKAELDDIVGAATARGNAALDRREREMEATPKERLTIEQERAAEQDEEYEAVRRKIERGLD